MTKLFLTVITVFLSLGFSVTASAHSGHENASVMHLMFHAVVTVSIYLSLMAAGFYVIKRLPKAIKQRVKK
ncbi:hypothetical protein [uncultured Cocleimonas sp.]|jgi:hypothetical protein|uniref:hypothetical protein n=1 Tax=uncultured Cocleimonas sp. TaxID=1051587 RepID=UPI00261176CD|nr:hypothetical protein [uncultured Cocleimonas sp.]